MGFGYYEYADRSGQQSKRPYIKISKQFFPGNKNKNNACVFSGVLVSQNVQFILQGQWYAVTQRTNIE